MRQFLRRLILTASLLLLVAATIGWIRGYWACDGFYRVTIVADGKTLALRNVGLTVYRGSVGFHWSDVRLLELHSATETNRFRAADAGFRHDAAEPSRHQYHPVPQADFQNGAAAYGFGWESILIGSKGNFTYFVQTDHGPVTARVQSLTGYTLVTPWWTLVLLASLAPFRTLWNVMSKRRRRPPHACPSCGYDIRATADPTGPRLPICPECGQTVTEEPAGV